MDILGLMFLIAGGMLIYTYGFSALISGIFFGIPTLKKGKQGRLIKKDAPNYYIIRSIFWTVLLIVISFVVLYYLKYDVAFIITIIFSLIISIGYFNKNEEKNNKDFSKLYKKYFTIK